MCVIFFFKDLQVIKKKKKLICLWVILDTNLNSMFVLTKKKKKKKKAVFIQCGQSENVRPQCADISQMLHHYEENRLVMHMTGQTELVFHI